MQCNEHTNYYLHEKSKRLKWRESVRLMHISFWITKKNNVRIIKSFQKMKWCESPALFAFALYKRIQKTICTFLNTICIFFNAKVEIQWNLWVNTRIMIRGPNLGLTKIWTKNLANMYGILTKISTIHFFCFFFFICLFQTAKSILLLWIPTCKMQPIKWYQIL